MAISQAGRRHRAIAAHRDLLRELGLELQDRLGRPEAVAFETLLEQQLLDIYEPLDELYGSTESSRMPDAYEQTISDVFPDRAPSSFTWFDDANGAAGGWVWTTFWSYQWDLNYANPNVLVAMLQTILWLANRGVGMRVPGLGFAWLVEP